jgi:hypothetical protein
MPRKKLNCNCECHAKKPTAKAGGKTAYQQRFAEKMEEAKKIHAQHPDWAMSKCVKEAWAK